MKTRKRTPILILGVFVLGIIMWFMSGCSKEHRVTVNDIPAPTLRESDGWIILSKKGGCTLYYQIFKTSDTFSGIHYEYVYWSICEGGHSSSVATH